MENKKDNGQYGRVKISNKGKITLKDNNIMIPDYDITKKGHITGDFLIDAASLAVILSLLKKGGCTQTWVSPDSLYSATYYSKDDIFKEVAKQYEGRIEKLNEYLRELENAHTKLRNYRIKTANSETRRTLWNFVHNENIRQQDYDPNLSIELERYLL